VWSFHIRSQGTGRCRLISRSRAPRAMGWEWVSGELYGPVALLATRKLLLGIKARAESEPAYLEATESGGEPTDTCLETR
ncbi:MAG: hypothetical protein ABI368_05990, partial [Jatrophihabitantaceae bacterium]